MGSPRGSDRSERPCFPVLGQGVSATNKISILLYSPFFTLLPYPGAGGIRYQQNKHFAVFSPPILLVQTRPLPAMQRDERRTLDWEEKGGGHYRCVKKARGRLSYIFSQRLTNCKRNTRVVKRYLLCKRCCIVCNPCSCRMRDNYFVVGSRALLKPCTQFCSF